MSLEPATHRVPHLNRSHRLRWGLLPFALISAALAQVPQSLDWDAAFADRSTSAPLHFTAEYRDSRGTHRLEEWRDGFAHLRRRTDDRIDLHADAASRIVRGQAVDYLWQVVDLDKKIDNRISSTNMLHTGMLYSFWSMAHVLSRPAGRVTITATEAPQPLPGQSCRWYTIAPEGQPATRACWSTTLAIPLAIQAQENGGSWSTIFHIQSMDRKPLAPAIFAVDTRHLKIRNLDQLVDED